MGESLDRTGESPHRRRIPRTCLTTIRSVRYMTRVQMFVHSIHESPAARRPTPFALLSVASSCIRMSTGSKAPARRPTILKFWMLFWIVYLTAYARNILVMVSS